MEGVAAVRRVPLFDWLSIKVGSHLISHFLPVTDATPMQHTVFRFFHLISLSPPKYDRTARQGTVLSTRLPCCKCGPCDLMEKTYPRQQMETDFGDTLANMV